MSLTVCYLADCAAAVADRKVFFVQGNVNVQL